MATWSLRSMTLIRRMTPMLRMIPTLRTILTRPIRRIHPVGFSVAEGLESRIDSESSATVYLGSLVQIMSTFPSAEK